MEIKILYFASVKQILHKSEDVINVNVLSNEHNNNELTTEDIFNLILEKYTKEDNRELDKLKSVLNNSLIAINDEYIDRNSAISLSSNDIISVIPPISGG